MSRWGAPLAAALVAWGLAGCKPDGGGPGGPVATDSPGQVVLKVPGMT